MTSINYGPLEDADRKFMDVISKTNILIIAAIWVVSPYYRKYLTEPLKEKFKSFFRLPFSTSRQK